MLPPPEGVLAEQLDQIEEPEQVFAVLQFNNNFSWHRVAWSRPGVGGNVYHHTHAEVELRERIEEFIRDRRREIGGSPERSAITIKYSPCPECSRSYLNHVSAALRNNGFRENYLYYLVKYEGLGALDALQGISIAMSHFTEVGLYSDVRERKHDWRVVAARYWQELGLDAAPRRRRR